MESQLRQRLNELERLHRGARLRRRLAYCWAATAAAELCLVVAHRVTGWETRLPCWLALAAGLMAAFGFWRHERRRAADLRAVAAAVEREHREVRHLLTTAAEQEPDPATGEFGFLQWRVIEQVLAHRGWSDWEGSYRRKRSSAALAQNLALVALAVGFGLAITQPREHGRMGRTWSAEEINVTPGDTEVERGTGLVVTARFGATPPAEATLVMVSAAGATRRVSMARQLADPVFGASLSDLTEGAVYRIEYAGRKTREYKIGVYDYPALTRADATLEYPEYTGLTNQTIRDTLRVSAVEGTRLTYTLQLNKPVAHARFVGQAETLALHVQSNATAQLNQYALTNSRRWALELVDADGRTNKSRPDFSLVALPARAPEVKLVFPHGDQRVSSLEELDLEGEARADFGLLQYGLGYSVAGREPHYDTLGQTAPANVKCRFTNQLTLENLGLAEDQVVSYFAWADDRGPDGRVRRTFSDMFFAEIRPFEEVFRADQSGESGNQEQGQGGEKGGNQSPRLAELQKQILIATWKLQQEKDGAPRAKSP